MKGGNFGRKAYFARFIIVQIGNTHENETTLLAIPEICADKIISLYHSSLQDIKL